MAKKGCSPIGYLILIIIGGFIFIVQTLVEFISENPILFFGILIAIVVLIVWVSSENEEAKQIEKKESELKLETFKNEINRIGDEYKLKGLPDITSDIPLRRAEALHIYLPSVTWSEYRKVTKGVSYSGLSYRIPIAKGLSYRVGQFNTDRNSVDQLTEINQGSLYFTSNKIFFRSTIANKTLSYDTISGLNIATDGFVLERFTGKNIFFNCPITPSDAAILILLWTENRGYSNFKLSI